MAKYLDDNGLLYLWSKIKAAFVAKEAGKGLSTNDLTAALKTNYDAAYTHSQAAHAPSTAEANVQSDWNVSDSESDAFIKNKPTIPSAVTVDSALSDSSTNPVQNKIVKGALDGKAASSHTHTKANITDFPTTMTPTAHNHVKADVTDFPTSMTPTAHNHVKADVTDFPTTMTPTAHKSSHASGGADALSASDIGAAAATHVHTVSAITDFPSTMTPSAHTHVKADVTDFPTTVGDMLKATYDTDNDGKVDSAEDSDKLGGVAASGYASASHNHTTANITDFPSTMTPSAHTHVKTDVTDFPTTMTPTAHAASHASGQADEITPSAIGAIAASTKGQANGVASLGADGLVPSSQLPSFVDDVVELLSMVASAPATCATGDLYYNTSNTLIYTATGTNTWGAVGATPEKSKIYIDLETNISYRWGGSAMVQITSTDMTAITNGEIDTVVAS